MTSTRRDDGTGPTALGPALELEAVRKVYGTGEREVVALDHVTLEVGADEILALLGPSGSGKTTLCSIAGGILSASEGRVVVGGRDITGLTSSELTDFRRDNVGFVFQSVNLVPFKAARERAAKLLEDLGLEGEADRVPAELSGGQRQRVAIGRALMNEPDLVLLDEPTSALDSKLGEQVMDLVRTEMKRRGTAAIVVTHDRRIVDHADRTVEIVDGHLDEPGPSTGG